MLSSCGGRGPLRSCAYGGCQVWAYGVCGVVCVWVSGVGIWCVCGVCGEWVWVSGVGMCCVCLVCVCVVSGCGCGCGWAPSASAHTERAAKQASGICAHTQHVRGGKGGGPLGACASCAYPACRPRPVFRQAHHMIATCTGGRMKGPARNACSH